MLPAILPLKPSFVPRPWGGSLLKQLKGQTSLDSGPIGESWEISLHPDGPSFYQDRPLPKELKFDYLVKLIEAKENLSVQVHPDDDYARMHENSWGKSECWLILSAESGSGIYLGLQENVTAESFEKAVREGENLVPYLRFHQVRPGDFFYVPAGTVHAIGAGVCLAEVQQSSGITYRVWDWNRLDAKGKSRELHIDKAMQVINFSPEEQLDSVFKRQSLSWSEGWNGQHDLVEHPQFSLCAFSFNQQETWHPPFHSSGRPAAILVLEGHVAVKEQNQVENINSFHSALCLKHSVEILGSQGAKVLWVY